MTVSFQAAVAAAVQESNRSKRLEAYASILNEEMQAGRLGDAEWAIFDILVEDLDPQVVKMFREFRGPVNISHFDSHHIHKCMERLREIYTPGTDQD